jgi:hypothetical protein
MSISPYSGCPWDLDLTCIDVDQWNGFDPAVKTLATALASASLSALSAYRVGGCPITVRPGRQNSCCIPAYDTYGPRGSMYSPGVNVAGLWINTCGCNTGCDHGPSCSVRLPAPVGRLDEIRIDGVVLDLTDFRVDNGNLLVYGGNGDCPLPDTEVGTWSVTYLNSFAPDLLAQQAAAKLAFEFALSCGDDLHGQCRLPSGVTTIVRTGVTMEMAAGLFPEGFTGIPSIDAWISLVNPRTRKTQTRVSSPDVKGPYIQGGRPGTTTWDGGSPFSDGGQQIDGGTP